jgi:TatD DNase family protein
MLGLHPWQVAAASPDWHAHLRALLEGHRAGVGECGLDFSRKAADRVNQEQAFRQQLRLAHALRRPVALHVVQAWGPLLQVLQEEGVPPAGAMIHAFSGSPEVARELQAMGLFLSFSGDLLRPERVALRAALGVVHPGHLLLETDGRTELSAVISGAAALLGGTAEDLAAQTWENGQRCFQELLA